MDKTFEDSNENEQVWSVDVEHAFHEALQKYPPCGRRKVVVEGESRMYGIWAADFLFSSALVLLHQY